MADSTMSICHIGQVDTSGGRATNLSACREEGTRRWTSDSGRAPLWYQVEADKVTESQLEVVCGQSTRRVRHPIKLARGVALPRLLLDAQPTHLLSGHFLRERPTRAVVPNVT